MRTWEEFEKAVLKNYSRMVFTAFLVLLVTLSFCSSIKLPLKENLTKCQVIKIVDGDTIHVIALETKEPFEENKEYTIRFIGINTPEITMGKNEPYGQEAANYTKEKLLSKTVFLEIDVEPFDKYNRVLAYIWLDIPLTTNNYKKEIEEKLFNYILVSNGYANVMTVPPNVKYQELFVEGERIAREKKLGLWGLSINQSSQQQSQSQPQSNLQIVQLNYRGANESVVIKNVGTSEINLSGWTLKSSSGNQTYKFPNVILKPGQTISVHSGPQASGSLIWTTRYIWNDNGDEAILIDSSGKIVSRYKY